jgi:predicted amidohydrolase YtcJ
MRPWAEAMVLEGGALRGVGPAREFPDERRVVDLQGAFVMPGLVDAHAHVLGFGLRLERVDLTGTTTLAETVERVRRGVAERRERGRTGWIRGRGWDQNDWPDTRFPAREDLDRVTGDEPAALTRVDGHAYWVNSRALALAGITRETPDPPGGKIHRDKDGNPTGILVDDAMDPVTAVIPEATVEEKRVAIERATETLVRAGLTGVHDMGASAEDVAIYRALAQEGKLPVRIYGAIASDDPKLEEVLAEGPDREWVGGSYKLGMVKFYVDGALGSRGAALEAPYRDDPGNVGLLRIEPEALKQGMKHALGRGFQCAVHAIGDRGNRVVLDAWESQQEGYRPTTLGLLVGENRLFSSGLGDVSRSKPPVRVEHAQILRRQDIPRLAELGVVASMQPTHCTSDMPWATDRLGPERLRGAYAWRSLIDAGAVFAAGSDFPVESHDPRLGIYTAVTRHEPNGTRSWSPQERLTREEALTAFTAAPAYASGDLPSLGTLTPGKLADFVVLDRNLATCDPESILTARPLLSVMGGEVRWLDPTAPFAGALKKGSE